jgi:hypothetical protein
MVVVKVELQVVVTQFHLGVHRPKVTKHDPINALTA